MTRFDSRQLLSAMPSSILGAEVEAGTPYAPPKPLLQVQDPANGVTITADPVQAFIEVTGVGCYSVAGGQRITACLEPAASPRRAADWLQGMVSAFVLAQQGRFALHACAVEVADGSAVAIAGESRVGKTTAALAAAALGHTILTDDVTVVDWVGQEPWVSSTGRSLHVWPDTAEKLGLELSGSEPVVAGYTKLALPPLERLDNRRLSSVAVIRVAAFDQEAVTSARVGRMAAVELLERSSYRHGLLRCLYREELFRWAVALAEAVEVSMILRPEARWSASSVAIAALGKPDGPGPVAGSSLVGSKTVS